jgi:2-methylcitrate dehydratase PrpD
MATVRHSNTPSIAAQLAREISRFSHGDLPPLAIEHAQMMIASTLASAAAGRNIRSSRVVRELAKEQGGTPEASIWFDTGGKIPAVNAARANALASDAAASDDSDLRTIAHLGTQLTSCALALAERHNAPGRDVLTAMVLGYEIAGRMAASIMPQYRDQGFHGSLCVIFASAVASACMLKLNEKQMTQTIAMAAVSMGGLGTAADTSEAREWFAGNAALLGMNAAYAAQKGYEVEERILETKKGFFDVYGAGKADIDSVTRDWGSEWDIVTDMAIKLVPGGHPSHALGEAAAKASRQANVPADQVDSIIVQQPLNPKLRVGPMRAPSHPTNLVEIAHTPAYFVAAGVADKSFGWVHASEAKIHDPVIHALIDKIKVGEPVADPEGKFRHGAVVTVVTKDGRRYTGSVHAPRGSGAVGIEWKDVEDKFRTLVGGAGLATGKLDETLSLVRGFRELGNVGQLIDLLR